MIGAMERPYIAQKIREMRLSRGLSMEELARRVGVSKETIRLWEGGRSLRGANLLRLAQELGAAPGDLSVEEPERPERYEPDAKDPYPSRREFFLSYGNQLNAREATHIRSLSYVGDPGAKHWPEELMRYREINRAILEAFKAGIRDKISALPASALAAAGNQPGQELPAKLRAVLEKKKRAARRSSGSNGGTDGPGP